MSFPTGNNSVESQDDILWILLTNMAGLYLTRIVFYCPRVSHGFLPSPV